MMHGSEENFQQTRDKTVDDLMLAFQSTDIPEEKLEELQKAIHALEFQPSDIATDAGTDVIRERFYRQLDLLLVMYEVSEMRKGDIINWDAAKATFEKSNDLHFSVCLHIASAAGLSEAAGSYGVYPWFIITQEWQRDRNITREQWLNALVFFLGVVHDANKASASALMGMPDTDIT